MDSNKTPTAEAQAYAQFNDLATAVANDMFRQNTVTHGEVDRVEAALADIVSFCETDLEKRIASEGRAEFVAVARAYAR